MKKLVSLIIIAALTIFPSVAQQTQEGTDLIRVVRAGARLTPSYVPQLVDVTGYTGFKLRPEAEQAFTEMMNAMKIYGIKNAYLKSAYRSYNTQQYLFLRKVNDYISRGYSKSNAEIQVAKYTARAGESEHQMGLAVDISVNGTLTPAFKNTAAGKWLAENCYKYGFILRYPSDKVAITGINYEPWHFRYVGRPHSDIIMENGWCLEEYLEHVKKEKVIATIYNEQIWEIKWSEQFEGQDWSIATDNGYILACYAPPQAADVFKELKNSTLFDENSEKSLTFQLLDDILTKPH